MKFTPETLLQIYLDGSFTEEAQAEFDALMRKDPAFTEKAAQALAERLGPVPDATVDAISSSLDGKIGEVWNRHKPAPWGQSLPWALRAALVLSAAALIFFGGWLLLIRLHPFEASGTSTILKGMASTMKPAAGQGVQAGGMNPSEGKKPVAAAAWEKTSLPEQAQALGKGLETSLEKNPAQTTPPLSPASPNSTSLSGSSPASFPEVPPSGPNPSGASLNTAPTGTTAEGNSLRVAIDMDKTQDVTLTVYDANGSLVRRLFSGAMAAGEHDVDWDGKDESGNAVVPGDYTVILDTEGKRMSGTLKVLPNP